MSNEQLLMFFVSLFPEFEKYWNSEGDIYREGDDYTIYSVCSVFSWYFRDNYKEFSHKEMDLLFHKIDEIISDGLVFDGILFDEKKLDAANALCVCFLENIAGEDVGRFSRDFMGNKSKEFFDKWN